MHHEPHVGLVDTHAERNRSDNDLHFFHQKRVLVGSTSRRIHAGVIGPCGNTVHFQHFRQVLHFLARKAIDDSALAFHAADEADEVLIYVCCLGAYFVIEVRAVETRLENRCVRHAEVLLNIFLHFGRSRSRKRDNRRLADALYHASYLTVFWTEVVSPLGDTMSLIHCIERNLHALKEIHVLRLLQALRRQVQQLRSTRQHIFLHRGYLRTTQA